MSRGYSASTTWASDSFSNTIPAPNTGPGYEYNTGADTVGSSGLFDLKRTHNLANGQVIWDMAGSIHEWNNDTCTQGSGAGNWYNSSSWIDWNNANLSDYEIGKSGANPSFVTSQNIGRYLGCTNNGNGLLRGGYRIGGLTAGLFTLAFNYSAQSTNSTFGFRCVR